MDKQALLKQKERTKRRLDYLWTNEAISDEAFIRFWPKMIGVTTIGLIPTGILAFILNMECGYAIDAAIKLAVCFYLLFILPAGMVIREHAYRKATEVIQKRRKKTLQQLDTLRQKIRETESQLEFIFI